MTHPELIVDQSRLDEIIPEICDQPSYAMDTEFKFDDDFIAVVEAEISRVAPDQDLTYFEQIRERLQTGS